MAIGANIASGNGTYLVEDSPMDDDTNINDEDAYMVSQDENHLIYDLCGRSVSGDIGLDEIMVYSNHARQVQGVYPTHISKIFIIDLDDANITLYVSTQMIVWYQDPNLTRKYGNNNHIIWYKYIQ